MYWVCIGVKVVWTFEGDLLCFDQTILLISAPRGKRGWKTFYGILKGLILYLQKVSRCDYTSVTSVSLYELATHSLSRNSEKSINACSVNSLFTYSYSVTLCMCLHQWKPPNVPENVSLKRLLRWSYFVTCSYTITVVIHLEVYPSLIDTHWNTDLPLQPSGWLSILCWVLILSVWGNA